MANPDVDTVTKIAALARLDLRGDEATKLAAQFARTLQHFEALAKLDVSGVEPMVGGRKAAAGEHLRSDEPWPPLKPDEALHNAPARVGDFYSVPKTIGAEE